MHRSFENSWLVTDGFRQKWRLWIVPVEERPPERISRWDPPDDPLSHLIYFSFTESRALCDDPARDLLEIYDVLTGARLSEMLPYPTKDPRGRLRGFKPELTRVLSAALEDGVLKFERHEVPWPFPEKEKQQERPDGRSQSSERSFYELTLLDELEKPLSGVRIRMETPAGTSIPTTDAGGRVRIDNVPTGVGHAQIANAAELAQILEGRERKPRRKTPLPEGEQWHFCLPSRLEESVALPAGEAQKLMIITRSHFGHFAQGRDFRDLSLRKPGPWLLEEKEGSCTLEMHSSGSAGDAVICAAAAPAPAEPSADSNMDSSTEWIRAAVDSLHESLFAGKFEPIWAFLQGIPLDAPLAEEDATPPLAEEILFARAMAELELDGWSDPESVDEGKQV